MYESPWSHLNAIRQISFRQKSEICDPHLISPCVRRLWLICVCSVHTRHGIPWLFCVIVKSCWLGSWQLHTCVARADEDVASLWGCAYYHRVLYIDFIMAVIYIYIYIYVCVARTDEDVASSWGCAYYHRVLYVDFHHGSYIYVFLELMKMSLPCEVVLITIVFCILTSNMAVIYMCVFLELMKCHFLVRSCLLPSCSVCWLPALMKFAPFIVCFICYCHLMLTSIMVVLTYTKL